MMVQERKRLHECKSCKTNYVVFSDGSILVRGIKRFTCLCGRPTISTTVERIELEGKAI